MGVFLLYYLTGLYILFDLFSTTKSFTYIAAIACDLSVLTKEAPMQKK